MRGNIRSHLLIRNPQTGTLGLSAEDHGLLARLAGSVILTPPHGQVDFDIAASAFRLLLEVVGEMLRVFPKVAVNVDQHEL